MTTTEDTSFSLVSLDSYRLINTLQHTAAHCNSLDSYRLIKEICTYIYLNDKETYVFSITAEYMLQLSISANTPFLKRDLHHEMRPIKETYTKDIDE